jgi:hypothetical protein
MSRAKVVYKWNKETVQNLLRTNDIAVYRGLLAIYARQTDAEKASNATVLHNTVGFTGCDGEILSSFAKQLQSRGFLSEKQMVILRKKMLKYWKQLVAVATENGKNPVISK